MKKMYLEIIFSILIFCFGVGCKPLTEGSDLTTVTIGTKGFATALKNKETQSSIQNINITSVAILIAGYKQGSNDVEFKCYSPSQTDDKNSEGCIVEKSDSEGINTSSCDGDNCVRLKHLFGIEKEGPKLDPTKIGINSLKINKELQKKLKDENSTSTETLASIQIQYNSNYDYYGFMYINCTYTGQEKEIPCMYTTQRGKKKAEDPKETGDKLLISIPLEWTKEPFGGKAAFTVQAADQTVQQKQVSTGNETINVILTPILK